MSASLAIVIAAINYIYFRQLTTLFAVINLLAFFVMVFPIVIIKYNEYNKRKMVEERFQIFLRDFVESVRGGMTVSVAFKSVSTNDYGPLSYYVKKMAAQLEWGIPLDKVLTKFAKETKSKLIGRIVSSVIESHRFGGNLANVFEALGNTAVEVDRLRAERKLYLNSQLMTGYIIFFVFLVVIIALGKFLVPSLTQVPTTGVKGFGTQANCEAYTAQAECVSQESCVWRSNICSSKLLDDYKVVFRNLIIMQGLFAGLAVGKMAEGAIIAGLKHSLFMMFVGSLIFVLVA